MKKIKCIIFILLGVFLLNLGISVMIEDKIFSNLTIYNIIPSFLILGFGLLLCITGTKNLFFKSNNENLIQNNLVKKSTEIFGVSLLVLFTISFIIVTLIILFLGKFFK